MRSIDQLANEICSLAGHINAANHRVQPGCSQPPGDAGGLPVGKFRDCWRGERMDMDLAVDLMIRKSQKAGDVPAGTSEVS